MSTDDEPGEILDAQIIFHPHDLVPSLTELTPRDREVVAVEMATLAMDSVGVTGALWHGEPSICETALSLYPDRFRAMAYFPDPQIPDVEQTLARLADTPGMRGIRLTPAWPPTGENIELLRDGAFDIWFATAQRLGMPISLFMPGSLKDVPAIAEAYPSLRLLIDHIGMIPPPMIPLVPDRLDAVPELLALARYENVAVKCSGVPALSYERYPFQDMWPTMHSILEAFGPGRMMWGSDFRRLKNLHTYSDVVDFIRRTDELSTAEKRQLLSESLREWVGWSAHSSDH